MWVCWSCNRKSILIAFKHKSRYNCPTTKMFIKLVRFCKVWPSLRCGLFTVNYINMKNFLDTLGPKVLQVLVEPCYCMIMKAFWNNHFAIFTEYLFVFDHLGGIVFLFGIFLKVLVMLLCLCYLSSHEWIDGVLFVLMGKDKVHRFFGVCCGFTLLLW